MIEGLIIFRSCLSVRFGIGMEVDWLRVICVNVICVNWLNWFLWKGWRYVFPCTVRQSRGMRV